jgi:lysophospholipase L1-like esterase
MKKISIFVSMYILAAAIGFATSPSSHEANEDDAATRENPELEVGIATQTRDYKSYPFINLEANHIDFNGSSWDNFITKINEIKQGGIVNIVHIGDSHIQADGNTGRVRKLLQQQYGNAGRGLMIPYRLAGTNQPLDYKISSSSPFTSAKLLKMPWPTQMGFTGISLHAETSKPTFAITSPSSFSTINIYGDGNFSVDDIKANGKHLQHTSTIQSWGVQVNIAEDISSAEICLSGSNFNVFGFDVRKEHAKGILYHSIGNNGATYSTYTLIGNVGRDISALTPDLIIISLGTNEAFGRTSDATFYSNIDLLVTDIRKHNPEALILLTTPSECQRSAYSTKAVKRRGRRRTTRVRTYQVNSNVNRMRNVILKYATDKQIAIYDFYEVAGGQGASAKWLQNRLLSSDRIHRTWAGYYLEGELLYHALTDAITANEHADKHADKSAAKSQHKHSSAKAK